MAPADSQTLPHPHPTSVNLWQFYGQYMKWTSFAELGKIGTSFSLNLNLFKDYMSHRNWIHPPLRVWWNFVGTISPVCRGSLWAFHRSWCFQRCASLQLRGEGIQWGPVRSRSIARAIYQLAPYMEPKHWAFSVSVVEGKNTWNESQHACQVLHSNLCPSNGIGPNAVSMARGSASPFMWATQVHSDPRAKQRRHTPLLWLPDADQYLLSWSHS